MTISAEPSKNYPDRLAVSHRLHPESNMTTVIELTELDACELILKLEEWQDRLRRERDTGL